MLHIQVWLVILHSKLNFQMQHSPFTAYISLKKSFMRDKSGNVVVPSEPFNLKYKKKETEDLEESLLLKVKALKIENEDLRDSLKKSTEELIAANEKIKVHENEIKLIKKEPLDLHETHQIVKKDTIIKDLNTKLEHSTQKG